MTVYGSGNSRLRGSSEHIDILLMVMFLVAVYPYCIDHLQQNRTFRVMSKLQSNKGNQPFPGSQINIMIYVNNFQLSLNKGKHLKAPLPPSRFGKTGSLNLMLMTTSGRMLGWMMRMGMEFRCGLEMKPYG